MSAPIIPTLPTPVPVVPVVPTVPAYDTDNATFEDVVNYLSIAKDSVVDDKTRITKTIQYLSLLQAKGYKVSQAVPQLNQQIVDLETFLDTKRVSLIVQLEEIATYAATIADSLPDISSIP